MIQIGTHKYLLRNNALCWNWLWTKIVFNTEMSIIKGKKLIQYRKWNVYYAQVLARSHFGNVGNHNLANFWNNYEHWLVLKAIMSFVTMPWYNWTLTMSQRSPIQPYLGNSLAVRQEIQRFESVHPSIYAIYDLIDAIPDPLIQQQIREHVVCIEGKKQHTHAIVDDV